MKLSDKVYNFLKWFCLIFLPALSVFYAVLDGAFSWGYTDMVCTILAAVGAFIGSLIGVSNKAYKEGEENENH